MRSYAGKAGHGALAVLALGVGMFIAPDAGAWCVFETGGNRLDWAAAANPVANVINTVGSDISSGNTLAAINAAQSTWNAVPSAHRSFAVGAGGTGNPFSRDGVNVIGFVDMQAVLGVDALAATLITYKVGGPDNGRIFEFGIALDTGPGRDFTWSNAPTLDTQVDLQSVMVHELGHALGFRHVANNGSGACLEIAEDPNGNPYRDAGPVMQPFFNQFADARSKPPNGGVGGPEDHEANPDRVQRILRADDLNAATDNAGTRNIGGPAPQWLVPVAGPIGMGVLSLLVAVAGVIVLRRRSRLAPM